MKRILAVFSMALALAVGLVAPLQAQSDGNGSTLPHNQGQGSQVDRTEDSSELPSFGLPEPYGLQSENLEHSLFHQLCSSESAGSEKGVSINTDSCHDDLRFKCWTCLQWVDGPVEPVCAKWWFTFCVHQGHCGFQVK